MTLWLTAFLCLPLSESPAEEEPITIWDASYYGFLEADIIFDTTQSFLDLAGNAAVARTDTYAGRHGRLTMGARNSRLGARFSADLGDVRARGVLEVDFLGNQTDVSEATLFVSPELRLRHFAFTLETDYLDILVGQTWQLFGWQPIFQPNTLDIQGVPGQLYARSMQVRLMRRFNGPYTSLELALSASRPPERDAAVPDLQAGARLALPSWSGMHTLGATIQRVEPATLGISAVGRRYAVEDPRVATRSMRATAGGLSVDLFLPLIPKDGEVEDANEDNTQALSTTASWVQGWGIADMYTDLTGGLIQSARDVDAGLVGVDTTSVHPIAWQTVMVGLQYYLPPPLDGLWMATSYAWLASSNAAQFGAASQVYTHAQWADFNIFWRFADAVQVGTEYAWFSQRYADGMNVHNHRVQTSVYYLLP